MRCWFKNDELQEELKLNDEIIYEEKIIWRKAMSQQYINLWCMKFVHRTDLSLGLKNNFEMLFLGCALF